MPFVHPARKRRRSSDDDEDDGVAPVFSHISPKQQGHPYFLDQPHSDRPRKTLPLPAKRTRISRDGLYNQLNDDKHSRRRYPRDQAPSPGVKSRPSAMLTPCHICSSRPTRKNHLDSFAYCQGCGEWTCYICIRECQGWSVDEGSLVSEQEALSRSFQMRDDDGDPIRHDYGDSNNNNNNHYDPDTSSRIDHTEEEEEEHSQQDKEGWSWKARGHQSIICRRCCVEQWELGGEVACWACHLALDGAVG